jgi:ribose transport system substrate-binding protein
MKFSCRIFVICILAFISLVHLACGTREQSGAKTKRLGFVAIAPADFWTIARKGAEKADEELNDVTLDFRTPTDGTAVEQKRVIDDLLAKGVDGLAISPADPVNQTQMINEVAKQVLVITQDSDAPQSNRACYIGTDNRAAGRQAGELIKEAIPNGGKIMIFVGKLDAQNAQERLQGIKDVLAKSNVQIIDVRTDDVDRVRAMSNVSDTLVAYPDVACLVGLWAYNGPAILSAVKNAGRVGRVKIVAFDEEDLTLEGVKDGAIHATIVQQPYEFGYQAIYMMAKVLRGDKSAIPPNKQVFIPTLVVKKDNVDDFMVKINQLRGRTK